MWRRTTSMRFLSSSLIAALPAKPLGEGLRLSQQLICRNNLAESRLMGAVAAVAVGVVLAHQLAVAPPQRRAVGVCRQPQQLHRGMLFARQAGVRRFTPRLVHPLAEPRPQR